MRVNYAIVFVSDMKQAVSFYRDVIGMPLKFESPGWTEFATEGATLARMIENKVTCLQEPKAMSGVRLAQYQGPDGLAISVGEG